MEVPDSELIAQCLRGHNNAFNILVERYQKQIYLYCARILGNPDDASDAVQDCFIKAYYALNSFRSDSPFMPWLFRIARNACIDITRMRSRRNTSSIDEIEEARGSLPSNEPNPEECALKNEADEFVMDAIQRLPERYRTAITLFHVNRLSIREISIAMGRPEGTVKSDLHHAREMLRCSLEGEV